MNYERKKYAVALVYQWQEYQRMETALRLAVITARSEDEALGMLVNEMSKDDTLKGKPLSLKTVQQIVDP